MKMSNDILSKAFTTTRRLELEYRKISLFRKSELDFETSRRIDETDTPSSIAVLAKYRKCDLAVGDF
jgi:hypothetical protein